MALTLCVTKEGFSFHGRAMNITKQKNHLLEPYGKMVHNYGIVLQLDPSEEQAEKLRQAMGCARVVHNDYIDCCKEHFAETGKYLGLSAYKSTRLPALKQEKSFLKEVEAKGGRLISVNRFFPSSQTCSCCGYRNQEVKDLNVRQWECPQCGTFHDRDVNAKENLLKEGIRMLKEEGIHLIPSSETIKVAC